MDVKDFLNRLDGVKASGSGWAAKCPAHDDQHASLSISAGEDGRILLKCHGGCKTESITAALGLTVKDLFPAPRKKERPAPVATYNYPGGVQKLRYADESFSWRRPDGSGGWIWDRKGVPPSLYVAGELGGAVCICEGEKDCDSLHRLGYNAASGADGAGHGKWKKEYTEQLKGSAVVIFQDNDKQGQDYAQETASALYGAGISSKVLDLRTVWPEIPEKADISDLIARFGEDRACEMIVQLIRDTPDWTPAASPFLACFKTLATFEEQEATWLIPGWVPEAQITLMAADGGIGKTTLWCNMVAGISSGRACFLDPPGHTRKPQKVAFLTTEDSVRKQLRRKLRLTGADLGNILTPDFMADKEGLLRGLKFGSREMEQFVRYFRPALVVFDPVQGFVPADINMGSRNAMRDLMAPLISLGEETGATFLVVCHTNKRAKAWGRDRIADSADLWDISRSVLMAGYTETQGVRYLSQEKNNYASLQETLLFSIDDAGQIRPEGTSWKRDREYTQDAATATAAPTRTDCEDWILSKLEEAGGAVPSRDLEDAAEKAGYSFRTLRRAKEELKQSGKVRYFPTGSAKGGNRVWHIERVDLFSELSDDEAVPWDKM